MLTECVVGIVEHTGRQVSLMSKVCNFLSKDMEIIGTSSIYIDEFEYEKSLGVTSKPLLAAISVKHEGGPKILLEKIKEAELKTKEISTREVISVLLLLYGAETRMTVDLTLPHPRLHSSPQLLYPAAEVAGNSVHPVIGKTLSELAANMGIKWGRYYDLGTRLLDFS